VGTKPRLSIDPSLNPWDQQPGESPRRFHNFTIYRDAGARRVGRVVLDSHIAWLQKMGRWKTLEEIGTEAYAKAIEKALRTINDMIYVGRWTERTQAFDRYMDRLAVREQQEAKKKAIQDAQKRHLTLTQGANFVAIQFLKKFQDDKTFQSARVQDLSIPEFLALIQSVIRHDRVILGVTEDAPEGQSPTDAPAQSPARSMSLEEARKIANEAAVQVRNEYKEPPPPEMPPDDEPTIVEDQDGDRHQ